MNDDNNTLRSGPRPLPLHLASAMMSSLSAVAALPTVRSGNMPWARNLVREAADLVSDLQAVDPAALNAAVMGEATRRLQTMIDGMEAYQRHAYQRAEPDAKLAFAVGNARLLDYGTDSDEDTSDSSVDSSSERRRKRRGKKKKKRKRGLFGF